LHSRKGSKPNPPIPDLGEWQFSKTAVRCVKFKTKRWLLESGLSHIIKASLGWFSILSPWSGTLFNLISSLRQQT
jgi:hypothetical protein